MTVLRIAILGAGIFIKTQHLPSLVHNKKADVVAIYSRSKDSAQALADEFSIPDVYYDKNNTDGNTLELLLARSDIDACVIALPILVQPDVIKKVLSSGKHVLAEKPVAKDKATAVELVKFYRSLPAGLIFSTAEQYRFHPTFLEVADIIKQGGIGQVHSFGYNESSYIRDDNPYYNTEWRKTPEYQGGFILDAGVHSVAAIRLVLGEDVESIVATTSLYKRNLQPTDYMASLVTMKSGVKGTFSMDFSVSVSTFRFVVNGSKGSIEISRFPNLGYKITTIDGEVTEKEAASFETPAQIAVYQEIDTFLDDIASKKQTERAKPEQSVIDQTVIETCLVSNGSVVTVE
ncbi:hypothetical protein CANCADRAFT_124427 [Tortispora caseinolytica NRRL Y-17796]|uniref:Gfo/Idh/MocA-like oxidoreductase N-terminal domain-containing protein n=1 Tax=Tortispora caseinolytica NRRL Y-17796 TaxID=767744 RepID=A0A1E4T9Y5_9ASCO|nr:hypothetical protein CANCADRAFT_124427 [Tortispora caseinolytica NRRL Y-17796]